MASLTSTSASVGAFPASLTMAAIASPLILDSSCAARCRISARSPMLLDAQEERALSAVTKACSTWSKSA